MASTSTGDLNSETGFDRLKFWSAFMGQDLSRSTKGASKQRRDLINGEIGVLRDLLPLPETARQRLSQLQVMSLTCVFIRKCNYFSRLFEDSSAAVPGEPPFDFSQSLTDFVLVTNREGKLLYISENVTEYLGHSMVDMMTQADCLYDIIDKRDHAAVQEQLLAGAAACAAATGGATEQEERTFFCRMNVARSFRRQAGFGDHKVMHVRGHFVQPLHQDQFGNQPVFIARCSPLITPDVKETTVQNNTSVFHTVHGLDMKMVEIGQTGEHFLGYKEEEVYGKSWYELLHPDDVMEAREKHIQLIKSSHEMGCMLTVRLQAKAGHWVWVNMVMHIRQPFVCDNGEPAIVCIQQVIRESEAPQFKLQSQLYSSHIARSPEFLGVPTGTSPSHTITQVPMETASSQCYQYQPTQQQQQPPPAGSQGGDEGRMYYHGVVVAAPSAVREPSGDAGAGARGVADPQRGGVRPSEAGGLDLAKSPSDLAPLSFTKADIVNKLKRKLENAALHQCKPPKLPRQVETPDGQANDGGHYGLGGHLTRGFPLDDITSLLGSGSVGGGGGVVRVMAPHPHPHDSPVFAQLGLKMAPGSLAALPTGPQPLPDTQMGPAVPLTPDSLTSEVNMDLAKFLVASYATEMTTDSSSFLNQLTVDIGQDSAVVPPSILTPEPSPAPSPEYMLEADDSPQAASPYVNSPQALSPQVASPQAASHQAASPQAESPQAASPRAVSPQVASPQAVSPRGSAAVPSQDETVTDVFAHLEELPFFDDVTGLTSKVKPTSRLAKCQQQQQPLLPVMDSLSVESFLYGLDEDGRPRVGGGMGGAQQVRARPQPEVYTANSPTVQRQSTITLPPELEQTVQDTIRKAEKDEECLERLVVGVAGAILDMINQAADGSGDLSDLDLNGGFMIVPSAKVKQETPMVASAAGPQQPPLAVSPSDGDLLDELHQLTSELAGPLPSYGERDLSSSFFDQTL